MCVLGLLLRRDRLPVIEGHRYIFPIMAASLHPQPLTSTSRAQLNCKSTPNPTQILP